jgi:hypothetical protein
MVVDRGPIGLIGSGIKPPLHLGPPELSAVHLDGCRFIAAADEHRQHEVAATAGRVAAVEVDAV